MNNKKIALKKFSASCIVLSLTAIWFLLSEKSFNYLSYTLLVFLILIGLYSAYQGFLALRNEKAGLLPIDEFSRKVSLRAAANTFYFSIIMWLSIILFVIDRLPETSIKEVKFIIFSGMAITAIFFLGSRIYYSKTGISDEN